MRRFSTSALVPQRSAGRLAPFQRSVRWLSYPTEAADFSLTSKRHFAPAEGIPPSLAWDAKVTRGNSLVRAPLRPYAPVGTQCSENCAAVLERPQVYSTRTATGVRQLAARRADCGVPAQTDNAPVLAPAGPATSRDLDTRETTAACENHPREKVSDRKRVEPHTCAKVPAKLPRHAALRRSPALKNYPGRKTAWCLRFALDAGKEASLSPSSGGRVATGRPCSHSLPV
jgi:hypothetical protein